MKHFFYLCIACWGFVFSNLLPLMAQTNELPCGITYKGLALDHVRDFNTADFTMGAEIAYSCYINPSFNWGIPFRLATVNIPAKDEKSFTFYGRMMGSLDGKLMYKFDNGYILKEGACIAPYLHAGIGLNYYTRMIEKGLDLQIPLGAGINFRVAPSINIQLQTEFRKSLTAGRDNWVHGLGLQFLIKGCCDKGKCCSAPEEVAEIKDVAVAVEDTDNDGVPNVVDDCPFTPGVVNLNGCPEISPIVKATLDKAMYIQFETASDKIKAESHPVLDEVVKIMQDNPTYHLELRGHTDSKGSEASNMDLSQRRALSAFNYLVAKGIDATRLASSGFGETSPIDTNDTEAGRSKNRRVEFVVR